jgi:cation diffusion facilitator family transporter
MASAARYAAWSVLVALLTMALKLLAWHYTGSVGLLSDALESSVNLAAASMAFLMLRLAVQPADEQHAYGHGKAEYFASGFEGALIVVAAISILWVAVPGLFAPQAISQTGVGLAICALAALLNFAMARVLMQGARRHRSLALEADAQHLMSDVWTSLGIIVGVALVAFTGWRVLDPLLAVLVALNILRTGWQLMKASVSGLMDSAWPAADRDRLQQVLDGFQRQGVVFHAIRTRSAGHQRFLSLHVLVPGKWSVQRGHDLLEQVERQIAAVLAPVSVLTHLEPLEDPAAYDDEQLESRP